MLNPGKSLGRILASAGLMLGALIPASLQEALNGSHDVLASTPRGRSRRANSERVKTEEGKYKFVHNGTNTPHGVPGAKLVRKAAEGRLGRYSGKRPGTVARALSK